MLFVNMFATVLPLLMLAAAASAGVNETEVEQANFRPFEDVDPNTLSCDPQGQIFLLLPHFTDCTKFYMCAHGEEVEFNCPGGLIFDFSIQVCNWDWATTCALRTPKDDLDIEGSGDDEYGIIGGEEAESGADSITADSAGTVRPISALNAQSFNHMLNCNRADAAARQLPYKGDCQRYWKCVAGIPQAVYCTDGLFFNQQTQQCDYEANAKCSVQGEDELQGEFIVYK